MHGPPGYDAPDPAVPVPQGPPGYDPPQGRGSTPEPTPARCAGCRFFVRSARPGPTLPKAGLCHRFPQAVFVQDHHWCGEFQRAVQG
jgi:hypothetical protein